MTRRKSVAARLAGALVVSSLLMASLGTSADAASTSTR